MFMSSSATSNSSIRVRVAEATDVPEIAHIHVETWRAAYPSQVPDAVLNALNIEHSAFSFRDRIGQKRGLFLEHFRFR